MSFFEYWLNWHEYCKFSQLTKLSKETNNSDATIDTEVDQKRKGGQGTGGYLIFASLSYRKGISVKK